MAWSWLVLRDRRWLHLIWLTVPITTLGLMDVDPFGRLFRQIDPAWLDQLNETSGQLFVTDGAGETRMVSGDWVCA